MSALQHIIVNNSPEIEQFEAITGLTITKHNPKAQTIEEFDTERQQLLLMPDEYYKFNVKAFCLSKCTSSIEINRVIEELDAFETHKMYQILQWLKYFVDTCNEKHIMWGVGRGSSVASYVLYLLGVHKINSIKYKLDWREFLR